MLSPFPSPDCPLYSLILPSIHPSQLLVCTVIVALSEEYCDAFLQLFTLFNGIYIIPVGRFCTLERPMARWGLALSGEFCVVLGVDTRHPPPALLIHHHPSVLSSSPNLLRNASYFSMRETSGIVKQNTFFLRKTLLITQSRSNNQLKYSLYYRRYL
jgi:hypothetical protein